MTDNIENTETPTTPAEPVAAAEPTQSKMSASEMLKIFVVLLAREKSRREE
jgi:hypothetical protein